MLRIITMLQDRQGQFRTAKGDIETPEAIDGPRSRELRPMETRKSKSVSYALRQEKLNSFFLKTLLAVQGSPMRRLQRSRGSRG